MPRSLSARAILSHIDPAYRPFISRREGYGGKDISEHGDQTHVHARSNPAATLLTLDLQRAGYTVQTGLWPTTLYVSLPAASVKAAN